MLAGMVFGSADLPCRRSAGMTSIVSFETATGFAFAFAFAFTTASASVFASTTASAFASAFATAFATATATATATASSLSAHQPSKAADRIVQARHLVLEAGVRIAARVARTCAGRTAPAGLAVQPKLHVAVALPRVAVPLGVVESVHVATVELGIGVVERVLVAVCASVLVAVCASVLVTV